MKSLSAKQIQKHLTRVTLKLINEGRINLAEYATEGLYSVYILEMSSDVWECNKCRKSLGDEWHGTRAFYVGMTNKTRKERLAEHVISNMETQNGVDVAERTGTPYTRGARMTRDHDFQPVKEIEPLDPDGYSLDGRLISDHAKLLEQIVIPTALRTLGFAAYAGAPEQFVVPPKTRT